MSTGVKSTDELPLVRDTESKNAPEKAELDAENALQREIIMLRREIESLRKQKSAGISDSSVEQRSTPSIPSEQHGNMF